MYTGEQRRNYLFFQTRNIIPKMDPYSDSDASEHSDSEEERDTNFKCGKIRFVVSKSVYQDGIPPVYTCPQGSVEGVYLAGRARKFPAHVNTVLGKIFSGEDTTFDTVKTPEDARVYIVMMLVAHYLRPWVKPELYKSIMYRACTVAVDLLTDEKLLDVEEEEEQLTVTGKRRRTEVATYKEDDDEEEGDSDDEEEGGSDDGEEGDSDDDDSVYSEGDSDDEWAEHVGSGASNDDEEEDSDEGEEEGGEEGDYDNDSVVEDESDLLLRLHERFRAFILTGANGEHAGVWKTIFAEWWERCFEEIVGDDELYDRIWPAVEIFGGSWWKRASQPDPHSLNNDIARLVKPALAEAKRAARYDTPLKPTRLKTGLVLDTPYVQLDKKGGPDRYFHFHAAFTQQRPFGKRVKIEQEGEERVIAGTDPILCNPILYTVTIGDLVKTVGNRNLLTKPLDPDLLFSSGNKAWVYDIQSEKAIHSNTYWVYHSKGRTACVKMVQDCHDDAMKSLERAKTEFSYTVVRDIVASFLRFNAHTKNLNRDIYYGAKEDEQNTVFNKDIRSDVRMTISNIMYFIQVESIKSVFIDYIEKHWELQLNWDIRNTVVTHLRLSDFHKAVGDPSKYSIHAAMPEEAEVVWDTPWFKENSDTPDLHPMTMNVDYYEYPDYFQEWERYINWTTRKGYRRVPPTSKDLCRKIAKYCESKMKFPPPDKAIVYDKWLKGWSKEWHAPNYLRSKY